MSTTTTKPPTAAQLDLLAELVARTGIDVGNTDLADRRSVSDAITKLLNGSVEADPVAYFQAALARQQGRSS